MTHSFAGEACEVNADMLAGERALNEPQRRLAPHIHIVMRGILNRTVLLPGAHQHRAQQVLVAGHVHVRYRDDELPVWHHANGNYLDRVTGGVLPTWEDALAPSPD